MATRDYRSSKEPAIEYYEKEEYSRRVANLQRVFLMLITAASVATAGYVFVRGNASQTEYSAKLEASLTAEKEKTTALETQTQNQSQKIDGLNGDIRRLQGSIRGLQDKITGLNEELAVCKPSSSPSPSPSPSPSRKPPTKQSSNGRS